MLDALSESHAMAMAVVVAISLGAGGLFAALLRGARAPGGAIGAAILGGLIAGALLGSTVLARVAPDFAEAAWSGGRAERLAFEERAIGARREVAALEAAGVTGVAIDEHTREVMAEVDPLREALEVARIERTAWVNLTMTVAACLALAVAPLAGWRPRAFSLATSHHSVAWIAGGIGSFVLASAFALVCLNLLTHAGFAACLALSCAMGAGWLAPPSERVRSAPRGERSFVMTAGAAALLPALLAGVWLLPDRRSWALVVAAMAMSVSVIACHGLRSRRGARRAARGLALGVIVPGLVALSSARVDWMRVVESRSFWIALVIVALACSDGRWLGGLLGSRSVLRATAIVTAGVGVPQIALLTLFDAGGPMTESFLAAGLLGALLVESSAGMYRWGTRWFVREAAIAP